jgi:ORF6N domain
MNKLIPTEIIENRIFYIRGHKVMIDRDLAELYQVSTKALNQAVKRNVERFPSGFIFKLTQKEKNELVTNCDRFDSLKHSSSLPYVFTEQGVAMLSSVLKSKRAIQVNILIMQTFVRLRELIASHKDIMRKIDELERKYDMQFSVVFDALRKIIEPPVGKRKKIGFLTENSK